MRLAVRRSAFDHPDWLFELKLDGFRSLAFIEDGSSRLVSRNAHAYQSFGMLAADLARTLKQQRSVLDGEIVCLDSNGCPVFDQLFYRRGDPYFYAFDLLYHDGKDLRGLPIFERKRLLRQLVPQSPSRLLYVSHLMAQGTDLYGEVCRRDLEGIVAKWQHGTYQSGDVTSWVKIKNPKYTQAIGRWEHFRRKPVSRTRRTASLRGLS
jgi:bifunctional non-homologous end joining protein LigD